MRRGMFRGFVLSIILGLFLIPNINTASAATVSSKTPEEVVAFLEADMNTHSKDYGAGLCLKYISDVYGKMGFDTRYNLGSAIAYWGILEDEGKAHYDSLENVPIGADVFFDSGSNFGSYGHVGIYVGDGYIIHNRTLSSTDYGVVKQKISNSNYYMSCYLGWAWHDWVTIQYSSEPEPNYVNIRSGVYVIHSSRNDNMCLDIAGNSKENNANIQLYHRVHDEYDVVQRFRVIKLADNDYYIQSMYNGLWLDVKLPVEDRANVKLYNDNSWEENHWSFQDAGNGYVYIKNKSGLYLDISLDNAVDNANVQLYHFVDNPSLKWRLEDVTDYYNLDEGVYTVHSARDSNYVLDIQGDSQDINANIQLYEQVTSPVQYFRFIKQNGNYTVQSVYSGLWLDIKLPTKDNSNVKLWGDCDSPENHWILENAGDGYVYMRSNADYYLDVQGDQAKNWANIQVYHFVGNNSQRWKLVKVEYEVKFDANGGIEPPATQTKSYGQTLTVSSVIPKRGGYDFLGWATSASATTAAYQPGGTYTDEANVTLYAVWKANTYTVNYNANGGTGAPASQIKTFGVDLTLSADKPTREGYSFICWSTSADAYANNRYPGSVYTGNKDLTLYAMWAENGTEMSFGAGRVLLDGDYLIKAALDETYAIDIAGEALPAADGTNVQVYESSGKECDVWTLTYLNNGFYAIKQYRTDIALTVAGGSVEYRANIQANTYTSSTAQQWSIEKTNYGFRLRARCSGFSVDVIGGKQNITNGTNIRQYVGYVAGDYTEEHAGNQSWTFKPYKPAQGLVPDLMLPANLKTIGEEAFTGGAFRYAKLAEGTKAIESKAFADCPNLSYIYIPESCATIAKDAFSGVTSLTIISQSGSYAEFYADKYGYDFETVSGD